MTGMGCPKRSSRISLARDRRIAQAWGTGEQRRSPAYRGEGARPPRHVRARPQCRAGVRPRSRIWFRDQHQLGRAEGLAESRGVPDSGHREAPQERDACRDHGSRQGLGRATQTQYLISHAEFLTAVPGEDFTISFSVNSKPQKLAKPAEQIAKFAEASLEMLVEKGGVPKITSCKVDGKDLSDTQFRQFPDKSLDPRTAGVRLVLQFFRRDQALKRALDRNLVQGILERYQGVRIFRDGINVPPYGLNGDDWASLDKTAHAALAARR